ncbi:MAG TPA: CBS domain-containing protein [Syntrophobacteraceae bacterium]|nr:CBS domain-containing protein [Syntrophobacteraceae bacterium]
MSLMRRGAISCGEETSIREVAQILAVNSSRYCVVTNKAHEVLGIVSARSLLKAFGQDLDNTPVKQILLRHTYTIGPNSPLSEAIQLMNRRKIEHVIVTSDRPGSIAVLGVLHVEDILSAMLKEEGSNKDANM